MQMHDLNRPLNEGWNPDDAREHIRSFGPHPQYSEEFLYALAYYCWLRGPHHWDENDRREIGGPLLREMPVLERPLSVNRGIRLERKSDLVADGQLRAGRRIRFNSFLSASSDYGDALYFMEEFNRHGEFGLLFTMHTKPGTRGIELEDFREYYLAGWMFRGVNEGEVILPPGTEWRVAAYRKMTSDRVGQCRAAVLEQTA